MFLCCPPSASAQIVELRDYHGEQIACVRSGLTSFAMPCGTAGYEYVFTGSVLSATELPDHENRLQLTPEEVFLGDPPAELTVRTNQGRCLPEIHAGDRWLFFLQRDEKTKEIFVDYPSGSGPVDEEPEGISLLRRLKQMPDSGVIEGFVTRPGWDTAEKVLRYSDVPKHKIVARRLADGVEYTASTQNDGNFEFSALPAGKYALNANTAKGWWAADGTTEVLAHGCQWVKFELLPDGSISGRVTTASGRPAHFAWLAAKLSSADASSIVTAVADAQGYFELKGLGPGAYLIGVGFDAQPDSPAQKGRVYYPGVHNRDLAIVIQLGQGEKRTGINFQIPNR